MSQNLCELIDTDVPADELERLSRVDALLRAAVDFRPQATRTLELTFAELTLIHKSLQAAKALGVLPPQDELLSDTIQLVSVALNDAS